MRFPLEKWLAWPGSNHKGLKRTNTRSFADVDGQLRLLPDERSHVSWDQLGCVRIHVLAHIDVARRMERHDGGGCRSVIGVMLVLPVQRKGSETKDFCQQFQRTRER